jgi:hypothetical protein
LAVQVSTGFPDSLGDAPCRDQTSIQFEQATQVFPQWCRLSRPVSGTSTQALNLIKADPFRLTIPAGSGLPGCERNLNTLAVRQSAVDKHGQLIAGGILMHSPLLAMKEVTESCR